MKILSPLSRTEEVKPLIAAGAEEFYCGVVTGEWEKRFGYIASSNLRHDKVANFSSFKELGKAINIASSHKVPVFCVFNAHFYSERQLPLALEQAEQAVDAGASKLIVSDISFVSLMKKNGLKADIALSTGNPAFNSASLSFFKGMGVKRVVLPRQMTVQEIVSLAKSAKRLGMETEAFVMNAICPYIDGYCTLQHVGKSPDFISPEELACRMPFEVEVISQCSEAQKRAAASKAAIWQKKVPESCGLCALPFFKEAGIQSLKIAGRGNSTEKKVADVKALKLALALLEKLPKEEFTGEMKKLFFSQQHRLCDYTSCYYPSAGGL